MKRALTLGALVAALAGCQTVGNLWDDFFSSGKRVQPTALRQFNPSIAVKQGANAKIGSAAQSILSPATVKDHVFAAAYDGKLARFDGAALKEAWRIDTGKKLSGGVGAGDNLVVVGTAKGEVLAYDFDGKPRWQARVSSEVLGAPVVTGDLVLVRSGDGRIFALAVADGTRKWLYQRATPALTVRSYASVLVDRNAVFAGFGGGKMVALESSSGALGWEASVALPRGVSEIERIADVTSNPVTDGRNVCAAAYQGRVACFDLQSGNLAWARDMSSLAGMAIDGRNVYVSDDSGVVHALDKSGGSYLWKQEKLRYRELSAPLVYRGYIVVGDLEGYVHFLSREDGSFAARIATDGSPIRAQPQALGDGVLVQTKAGGLYWLGVN